MELRGLSDRELRRIAGDPYKGNWTIWGWDGGFKEPRNVRARRTLKRRAAERKRSRS